MLVEKRILLFRNTIFLTILACSPMGLMQAQSHLDSLTSIAIRYYNDKDYQKAGELLEQTTLFLEYEFDKRQRFYETALAFAKAKDSARSFRALDAAIENRFLEIELLDDQSFDFMKSSFRWKNLKSSMPKVFVGNPDKVEIISKDVENFWNARKMAIKNPTRKNEIFKQYYFDKGSIGLQGYYRKKIGTIDAFTTKHENRERFYNSIEKNTKGFETYLPQVKASFKKLKALYANAVFPPIYLVIGHLNSAGTVSGDGLLLAMDQISMSHVVDKSELNGWERNNIKPTEQFPFIVAHELIHFQQAESIRNTAKDTTLLRSAIIEGMADFIGEKISGQLGSQKLHEYAKGRESEIWKDFQQDMFQNKSHEWIANGLNVRNGRPSDLGYLVGYWICKSYYEKSKDKLKAYHDMLNIKDFRKFYQDSGIERQF